MAKFVFLSGTLKQGGFAKAAKNDADLGIMFPNLNNYQVKDVSESNFNAFAAGTKEFSIDGDDLSFSDESGIDWTCDKEYFERELEDYKEQLTVSIARYPSHSLKNSFQSVLSFCNLIDKSGISDGTVNFAHYLRTNNNYFRKTILP
jgi:hypothetical protein